MVKVVAAGSLCNSSQVDLQAWTREKDVPHRIKVVHEGKGQWQERHEGEHFAVHAAAQVLMYMVGRPMAALRGFIDAYHSSWAGQCCIT